MQPLHFVVLDTARQPLPLSPRCQTRLQTLPVVAFVRQALSRASLQGGLERCGVCGRVAPRLLPSAGVKQRHPPTPQLLVPFFRSFLGTATGLLEESCFSLVRRFSKIGCSCVAVCLPRPHSVRPLLRASLPSSCSAGFTS